MNGAVDRNCWIQSNCGGLYWPPKNLLLSWTEGRKIYWGVQLPRPGNSNPDLGPCQTSDKIATLCRATLFRNKFA